MRNVMDLMEGDEGLRDRQGLDASMYVMGYIFKKKGKKMDWLCGSRGRRTAAKVETQQGRGRNCQVETILQEE